MLIDNFRSFNWDAVKREWRDLDILLLVLPITLTLVGVLSIHSTEVSAGTDYWLQHLVTGAIGVGLMLTIARWRYDQLLRYHWVLYGITIAFLIAVLFIGTSALGAQRWITIGGFNVQPSEFAKVSVIVTLAAFLHDRPIQHPMDIPRTIWVTIPPWVLIFLQPNLGTALVFAAITVGMLYWGGTRLGWLVLIVSPLISAIAFNLWIPAWWGWVVLMGLTAWFSLPWMRSIAAVGAVTINLVSAEIGHLLWKALHDYQKQRIVLFMDPNQDPLGGGYHLIQSRIAIGAGKLWGQGLMHGSQTQLNFIPEQHTDFIFAAIGEELGFVGGMFVLLTFFLICWRLLAIAVSARDNFGSLIAVGVLSMILFQTTVNIAMTIGIAPITGIPLPWLSSGKSALLTNFMALGLVESVAIYRRTIKF